MMWQLVRRCTTGEEKTVEKLGVFTAKSWFTSVGDGTEDMLLI